MAKSEKQPEISDWRSRIDELDLDLGRMLNERARCSIEIGRIKRKRKMPIYDPRREEEIIRMVVEHNPGPLDSEGIRRLFERIIDESRRIERVTADSTTRHPRQPTSQEKP